MSIVVLGIDLGKNSCGLVGFDGSGGVVMRRRLRRVLVEDFVGGLPVCIVAMEACRGAHHLGRVFAAQGDEVRLMSPEYVRPYVKARKNEERDAEAIAEAATRPTMRFVPVKSQRQSDIQSPHRARERLVRGRTALINHLRALLLERGITAPRGRRTFADLLGTFVERRDWQLSSRIRLLIEDLGREWRILDERIAAFDAEMARMAQQDEAARRLMMIPGIGPINATALVAALGDGQAFARGRDMAARLGLTPRQQTTGGKPRLLGIGKRGNRYPRKNLIHGARAVPRRLVHQETPLGRWARDLLARAHQNVVVVALANKLARIVWAVLTTGRSYAVTGAPA